MLSPPPADDLEADVRDFPARAWIYSLCVGVAAVVLGLLASPFNSSRFSIPALIGFMVLVLLAESVPVELAHASYSVAFVVDLAIIIALGPGAAALAAALGALDPDLRKRSDWVGRLVFNASQLSASAAVAGLTYVAFGGPVGRISGSDFPEALLPVALATLAHFVVNVA